MPKLFLVLVLIALCGDFGLGVKFPSSFKRCRVAPELDDKNNPCLVEAVEDAIRQLSGNGNSDLQAIDLDPLNVAKIQIEQGGSSPIAIKLEFTDNTLSGISNVHVSSVTGKLSSPKKFLLKMKLDAELLVLRGPYKVEGRVLILPIQGVGQSNLTMQNVDCSLLIKGEPQMKDGKEYIKIKKFSLKVYWKGMTCYFGNLFNGDKALGDNMNRFLNQNWEVIYSELREPTQNAFGALFEEYTKRIFEKLSFNEIFLVD